MHTSWKSKLVCALLFATILSVGAARFAQADTGLICKVRPSTGRCDIPALTPCDCVPA